MNLPIGIIDSGVGGLTIAQAVINKLPKEPIIYIADSKNCPYGKKSSKQIYSLSKNMIDFLLKKRIKMLIVACNTVTVTSIEKLRKDYPGLPIVGIVPVVKTAVEKSKNNKIGIFSSKVTAQSKYQKELIHKFAKGYHVINIGSAGLVSLIENLKFDEVNKVLKKELKIFKDTNIDVLALGCSHFPLVVKQIRQFMPGILILDSSKAVCRQVKRILIQNNNLSSFTKPSYTFYTTGDLKTISYFINKLTIKGKVERISLQ